METNHRGKKSVVFPNPPAILAYASVAGKKESQGPLRDTFDVTSQDTSFGQKTWEKAETQMQKTVLRLALEKAKLTESALDAARQELFFNTVDQWIEDANIVTHPEML